jgi:Uncharacterized conserved protein
MSKKAIIVIEKGVDGGYSVFPSDDIKSGIIGDGATVEEAKADFLNSYEELIGFLKKDGLPIPEDLQDVEFEFRYDLSSLFNYFNFINVTQFAKALGINSSLMRQYKSGKAYISDKQAHRIEEGIHRLGQQLMDIKIS